MPRCPPRRPTAARRGGRKGTFLKNVELFEKMLINIFMKNVDETFRKNIKSNVFFRKMLIQLFMRNVG
jgi:hypothetical protein